MADHGTLILDYMSAPGNLITILLPVLIDVSCRGSVCLGANANAIPAGALTVFSGGDGALRLGTAEDGQTPRRRRRSDAPESMSAQAIEGKGVTTNDEYIEVQARGRGLSLTDAIPCRACAVPFPGGPCKVLYVPGGGGWTPLLHLSWCSSYSTLRPG